MPHRPLDTNRLENHESYLICPGRSPVPIDPNAPVSRLHIIFHTVWHRHHDHNQSPQASSQSDEALVHHHHSNHSVQSNSTATTIGPLDVNVTTGGNSDHKHAHISSRITPAANKQSHNHNHRYRGNDHHRNSHNHNNRRKSIVTAQPRSHHPRGHNSQQPRWPTSSSTVIHIRDCSDEQDEQSLEGVGSGEEESNHITNQPVTNTELFIDIYHRLVHHRNHHRPRF